VRFFAALSKKAKEGEIRFFDTLEIESPKAKLLQDVLTRIAPKENKKNKKQDVLMVPMNGKNIRQASGSFTKLRVVSPKSLNIYDVLNHKNIFIDREAVAAIRAHYAKVK
jgi:ribosomal protein L4